MNWKSIHDRDPFLAGSIGARGHEWWMQETAESQAESVGLTGEARDKFLSGWNAEIAEQEEVRKEQMFREYEEMAQGYERGDPAR